MSQLLWTFLPNGLIRQSVTDEWEAHFSVFLTPRLSGERESDVLSSYPEFLNWPNSLLSGDTWAAFDVQLHDEGQLVSNIRLTPNSQVDPDSAAWRAVFPASTRVRSFTPPPVKSRQGQTLHTYPAGELLETIRSAYSNALAAELGIRKASPSLAAFDLPANQNSAPAPINASPVEAFARFFQSSGNTASKTNRKTRDEDADFHQIVAALGSYPLLLRKLGLVLDFSVGLNTLPLDSVSRQAKIRVVPADDWLPEYSHQSFWTAVTVGTESHSHYREFAAAPASADHAGARDAFGLSESSVALEKVEHAAFALIQQARTESDMPRKTLPALLQGGMRIGSASVPRRVRTAMQDQARLEQSLHVRLAGRRGINDTAQDDEPLYAEQLQRGIRVDVRLADAGQWRSLCARDNHFSAGDWQWPQIDESLFDEGCIEPSVFKDDNDRVFSAKVTEDLFEWDGWSLVVPRPDSESEKISEQQAASEAASGTPLRVATTAKPGSLQTQRFGQRYQFRIRSVDLAGNSLTLKQATSLSEQAVSGVQTTTPACYLRVESAKPPVVFRAQERRLGEAGDLIVLRDAEDPRYRALEFSVHVLPPEVPLRIAEKHGVFDGMNPSEAWRLIQTHRGKLEFDAKGNSRDALTEKEVYAPYLPDPMVKQAVLKIPGIDEAIDLPGFDEIPKKLHGKELARSVRLTFSAGKGRTQIRSRGREIFIDVPPGRVQTLSVAAKLGDEQLSQLALAHPDWQCESAGLHGATDALRAAAASGVAALLAPPQFIRVVHATQRPLVAPTIDGISIKPREAGSVKADLNLQALQLDRPSSGRIDMYARWQDPVDFDDQDGFSLQAGELYAGGTHVPDDETAFLTDDPQAGSLSPFSHDFGDTRHRRVQYRAVAQSRFIEYYPQALTNDPDKLTRASDWISLDIPATSPPDVPTVRYVLPLLHQVKGINRELNLQKDRAGEYGGAGLRVYLERGWFSSGAGEKLGLLLANSRTDDSLNEVVSDWGSNPLHASEALPGRMAAEHIAGGVQRLESVAFNGSELSMILFDVRFSHEHGLPFVDIPFVGQKAFMPMLRLGLARYQEHAIVTCHVSAAVQTDFVPLTPERSMTISKRAADTWQLSISGYGYDDGREFANGSLMQVQVEVLPRSAAQDSAAWRAIGEVQTIAPLTAVRWQHRWEGEVQIRDAQYLSPGWRRRLVVRELEIVDGDTSAEALQRARIVSAQTVRI